MATQGKQQHMRIVNGVIYYQDKDSLRKRKELATELLNTIQICEGGKLIFGKKADELIKKLDEHPQSAISNATAKLMQAKWDVAEAAKVHENDGLALTEKMDEDDVTVTCISSFNSQAFSPLDNGRLSDDDSSRPYVANGTTQTTCKPKVLKDYVSSSVSIMEYEETPVKVQNKRNKTTKTKGGKETTTSFKNGSGQQAEKMLWCKQKGCETYHRGIKRLRKHVTKKHPKVDAYRITEYNYVSYDNEIGLIGGHHEVPLTSSSSIRRPRAKPENKKSKGQKQRAASPVKCAEEERFFWCKQKGCNKYIQGITRLRNHVTKRHPKVDASRITQWNYATFDSLLAQSVPTVPTTDK